MIIAILVLMLMITIHEFGHFSMGKLLHVPVYEFSIGMGPLIKSWKGKSETKYSLRCIPIGGFCSFDKGDVTGIQDTALNKQPIWKRVIILFGGAGFNIISAFLVAVIVCGFIGLPTATTKISSIADERADEFFQPEDEIIAINGVELNGSFDVLEKELEKSDGKAKVEILRNGEIKSSEVEFFEHGGSWKMGVMVYSDNTAVPWNKVIPVSAKYCILTGGQVIQSLKGLFTGEVSMNDMSGVVGIVSVVGDAAKDNIINVLSYFIMISINLGIVNLLPIPVLDGSKIVFCIYEAIFKKRVPENFEKNITIIFAFLLIALMIYITIHDVANLVS